jgi:hypothetical protein
MAGSGSRGDRLRAADPQAADTDRLSDADRRAIVQAFFAHHQGMSLVALANVVNDDVGVRRFHADPRAGDRAPSAGAFRLWHPCRRRARRRRAADRFGGDSRVASAPLTAHRQLARAVLVERPIHGRHHTRRRRFQRGTGSPSHANVKIGRRIGAHYIYVRDAWSGEVWSPTYQRCAVSRIGATSSSTSTKSCSRKHATTSRWMCTSRSLPRTTSRCAG